ncbi:MAG: roadblock/LC7 domain-containing protein [Verrucomicrobia subdivision 3 bacterium]|nr:roadblock/LC7 domain-containing protein [Verrucomicrobiota bacterium]MCC6821378.1 roadblock/LC7 domain-containing protein [Limisphaerales bacterium]
MATLPQLFEEDVQRIDDILREFLERSDAATAIVIDKGGFLIANHGDARRFDLTTIAALASGAYMANQTIANLVHEENFDSVYQQGDKFSMFVANIDESCLLMVIFPSKVGVGIVKYHSTEVRTDIAAQLKIAQDRDPGAGLDLSVMNLADPSELFKRRV